MAPALMALFDQGPDLERLLTRCRRGDSESWSRLVERLQSLVYSIPRRYGLGPDDAADVFQTTFQALYRNLDRIESAQALPKWLSVTAARESLKVKRIQSRTTLAEDHGIPLEEIVAREDSTAESDAVAAESAMLAREAIGALDDRCRDLLTALYLGSDAPYAEISTKLGLPVGAIGPTRARCLDKLRKILEKGGFFA